MAKTERMGCYYGINKDGKVEGIYEDHEGSTIWLTRTEPPVRHLVEHGRSVIGEVRIVFGFTDIEFVARSTLNTEHENRVVENLKKKAESN